MVEKIRTLYNMPGRRKSPEANPRVAPASEPQDVEFQNMKGRRPKPMRPAVGPLAEPPVNPQFDDILGPSSVAR